MQENLRQEPPSSHVDRGWVCLRAALPRLLAVNNTARANMGPWSLESAPRAALQISTVIAVCKDLCSEKAWETTTKWLCLQTSAPVTAAAALKQVVRDSLAPSSWEKCGIRVCRSLPCPAARLALFITSVLLSRLQTGHDENPSTVPHGRTDGASRQPCLPYPDHPGLLKPPGGAPLAVRHASA